MLGCNISSSQSGHSTGSSLAATLASPHKECDSLLRLFVFFWQLAGSAARAGGGGQEEGAW